MAFRQVRIHYFVITGCFSKYPTGLARGKDH